MPSGYSLGGLVGTVYFREGSRNFCFSLVRAQPKLNFFTTAKEATTRQMGDSPATTL